MAPPVAPVSAGGPSGVPGAGEGAAGPADADGLAPTVPDTALAGAVVGAAVVVAAADVVGAGRAGDDVVVVGASVVVDAWATPAAPEGEGAGGGAGAGDGASRVAVVGGLVVAGEAPAGASVEPGRAGETVVAVVGGVVGGVGVEVLADVVVVGVVVDGAVVDVLVAGGLEVVVSGRTGGIGGKGSSSARTASTGRAESATAATASLIGCGNRTGSPCLGVVLKI